MLPIVSKGNMPNEAAVPNLVDSAVKMILVANLLILLHLNEHLATATKQVIHNHLHFSSGYCFIIMYVCLFTEN